MEKTVVIHLNQTIFNIEEKAYNRLQDYLDSIKKHFQKTGDADEIVSDIESSAAVHFSQKLNKNKNVITLEDVEELIKSMGTVDDISGDDSEEENQPSPSSTKARKLFRDTDNKILGGVASGIAAYFGIDPFVVRLLFVVIALIPNLSPFSIVPYIILWIITPKAKTTADKMMMKGDPVNLSTIENAVIEKSENIKAKASSDSLLNTPVNFLKEVLSAFFKVLSKLIPALAFIIGILIVIGTALGIAGLTTVMVNMIINSNIFFSGFDLNALLPGPLYPLTIVSVYISAFVPLVVVLLLGVSLMRRKSAFNTLSGISLLFIWIVSLITLSALAINIVPKYQGQVFQLVGDYQSENYDSNTLIDPSNSTELNLKDFENLSIVGIRKLDVVKSDEFKVVAYGQPDQISNSNLEVKNKTLIISPQKGNLPCFGLCNDGSRNISIMVYMPSLKSFKVVGNTQTSIQGFKEKSFELDTVGNSSTQISGTVDKLKINSTGNSQIDASNYSANFVEVKALGDSQITVNAAKSLKVDTLGNSKVDYLGNPVIDQKAYGNGSVEKIDILESLPTATPSASIDL